MKNYLLCFLCIYSFVLSGNAQDVKPIALPKYIVKVIKNTEIGLPSNTINGYLTAVDDSTLYLSDGISEFKIPVAHIRKIKIREDRDILLKAITWGLIGGGTAFVISGYHALTAPEGSYGYWDSLELPVLRVLTVAAFTFGSCFSGLLIRTTIGIFSGRNYLILGDTARFHKIKSKLIKKCLIQNQTKR